MKIGVDIDGVVANFVAGFIPLVKERYGLTLRERDIYVHDLYLVVGIPVQEGMELVRQTIRCDLEPYPGAIQGLARLRQKHEVTLVTARPEEMVGVTEKWLARRKIPYDRLLHFKEGSKYENEYAFDVFVDDHLREAFGFVGRVPHIIIFDRPWNRTFNVAGLFTRARNWRELVSLVTAWET
ncbi:MAG: hypothetical protein A2Y61_06160 [Chloroflexi bacterium RBG_13_60_13]|nr:MAG: hypothetical protein A2Y61_06160 [Chloroflexi bacterium RBG_13_60_13]